ncbi:MAG: hypothetical protein J2P48_21675 [Alphaproteobacteria bacterium]|nr:hypothetical protein [Alphaproteobacteria bacterium]
MTIQATGRGAYQRTGLDRREFPRLSYGRRKRVAGFQKGDMVRAVVPIGRKAGTRVGRVGDPRDSFSIQERKA